MDYNSIKFAEFEPIELKYKREFEALDLKSKESILVEYAKLQVSLGLSLIHDPPWNMQW